METFSALVAICVGNSPVPGEFPAQRPVTRNFDVFSDLHLNKRLSKQSWGWWFETLSRPLWRHCNERICVDAIHTGVSHSPTRTGWEAQQKLPVYNIIAESVRYKQMLLINMMQFKAYYPKKMQPVCVMSFLTGTRAILQLSHYQWSKSEEYG